jgi:hypothetical protein
VVEADLEDDVSSAVAEAVHGHHGWGAVDVAVVVVGGMALAEHVQDVVDTCIAVDEEAKVDHVVGEVAVAAEAVHGEGA